MSSPDPINDPGKRKAVVTALIGLVVVVAALLGVTIAWNNDGGPVVTEPSPSATPSVTPTVTPSPTPEPLRPSWQTTGAPALTFSDEFNDKAVDPAKWETGWFGIGATDPVNSSNDQCYNSSQVTEADGSLHLTAIQKPAVCKGATRPYTSGMVTTRGKFTQHFGSYEARICLPDADGNGLVDNFPAWWINGMASGFADGEIDVVEGIGGGRTKATVHYDATHLQAGKYSATVLAGCHNFGAEWRGDNVKFYYDGALLFDTKFVTPASAQLVLILNLAVDDSHSPTVVGAKGSDMAIDWVRVWK
jgi:beta-glucanase (GH16 family)